MAEDILDIYVDFAGLNVNQSGGFTLTLLRSVPPVATTPEEAEADKGDPPREIAARIRFAPGFAIALRDLLARTVEKTLIIEDIPQADDSTGQRSPSPSG